MHFRSAATLLRSFQFTKFKLARIKCTMQVCTNVLGNTASMASGKPFKPYVQITNASFIPRFFRFISTDIQYLAPSLPFAHSPNTDLNEAEAADASRGRSRAFVGAGIVSGHKEVPVTH